MKKIDIFKTAFKYMEDKGSPFPCSLTGLSDDQLLKQMFYNHRSHGRGLRLSNHGFYVLRQCFQFYTINLPEHLEITGKYHLYLDRKLKAPYHIQFRRTDFHQIMVFDDDDAMMLKLVSGDLDALTDMEQKKKAK